MPPRFRVVAVFCVSLFVSLPVRADERGSSVLARAVAALGQAQNLSARVEVIRRAGGASDIRSGRLLLRRPNFARADLGGRAPVSLVSTGKAIFLSSSKAYQFSPLKPEGGNIGESMDAPLVAFFFRPDTARLAPGFGPLSPPRYKNRETIGGVSCDVIEMTGTKPARCTVTLAVGPDGLPRRSLFRYQITPRFYEAIEVRLTAVAVNTKLAADAFRFVPPTGAINLTPNLASPGKPDPSKQQGDPGTVAPDGTIIRP